ncbi:uncharacterized protein C8Q71DRAFT_762591 [Rhodofomes roseus]|uniref:Secreted protein n=1 Tax=Rhodofomes roseus TaxID=34475 RepID=A0A4Y9Z4X4_9APHY|nr:uncharacterized protein C8Q71DRAFT_762591 [Rhodofomes roseus]KAH9835563.1 hypothetical protein C8Q71DRAFT_762591 [Rhodofomes roseus]TFY69745.1 hypothetical protein EVJ58_g213 [Rhodofomes roseus]
MPSVNRLLRLALQAACLAALTGVTIRSPSAVASPLPMPLWKSRTTDLVQRSSLATRIYDDLSYVGNDTRSGVAKHVIADYDAMPSTSSPQKRQGDANLMSNFGLMNTYSTRMTQNAQTINSLASQPEAQRSANFNQEYASAVSEFHENFLGFQTVLGELAADKGLANYNQASEMETMLKNMVNAAKYALNDTYNMVNGIPGLGPVLGPVVYQIKCLIDEILDATENMTDALLNDMENILPLLKALDGQAAQTACAAGIEIANICIPL